MLSVLYVVASLLPKASSRSSTTTNETTTSNTSQPSSSNSNHHAPTTKNSRTSLVVGSRESQLAMVQTELVVEMLKKSHPSLSLTIQGITTIGDQVLDVALSKIGSKSLFTKELEIALDEHRVDLVVHSLKDVPTTLPPGMSIGAILHREDPRDAVVMGLKWKEYALETLPKGSVVGTSSLRRTAQLKRKYPDLVFKDVRGNLNTRLSKLDAEDSPFACLLLAYAGLVRLGWHSRISSILEPSTILYAVGQGALAVEIRQDDTFTKSIVASLNHHETSICVNAERAFMRYLEGGCSVPIGVCTEWVPVDDATLSASGSSVSNSSHKSIKTARKANHQHQTLRLTGSVTSLDGLQEFKEVVEGVIPFDKSVELQIDAAEALGVALGKKLEVLGVHGILDDIKKNRPAPLVADK
ncbi:hydroxymethylbilane synthase [Synchytrium microbalum]|uniref:hydroxymethylbilane synthase n=1 Tax=Synchytrium microbalum TaxID=1806994 RepID=A0A507CCW9_9FUNG|nr:hydroxymethylbilane synthase [Synchytrium microbalum]TPX37188.1 hydroxymethylbilane synthase [Synchytrium microbalum]